MNLNQITLPCTNYVESVEFYRQLGLQQIVNNPPRYARFETSTGATLSIHLEEANSAQSRVVVYFEVEDVDAEVNRLRELGLEIESEPVDQEWLWREAYLRDPAKNTICIYHAGENRRFPPWRMADRTDYPPTG